MKWVLPRLFIIANILLFSYSTAITPTEATEIAMLSGRGIVREALTGVLICEGLEEVGDGGMGLLVSMGTSET
jgi:hypothetical protein